MIRNRVRWGYGLLALLLTLSTVACGGDEPAPVVQPPAPPPAPPPFQPQAVEVALGESGNVTLMTTEDGGFTLNGEAFESGGTVAAENGNMYLLTLADGKWSAAYQSTEAMVTLGITEEMVTLTKAEDGSYWIGDMAVTSGETTVSAENGNMYTLSMDEDGMWMATYIEPVQNVMLGMHGGATMVKKSEDGSYWVGDMTVMDGTVVSGEGGREYTLMMGEDGMWMATFVAPMQTVTLGMHGGSAMLTKAEDGSYWLGDMAVMDGSEVAGEGGRMYTLMMGEDGMWMATYVVPMQTVMLGMSGTSVMISKAEDGSYMIGDQAVMNGSTATAMYMGNTNTYSLMMGEDGMWSATYVAATGTVAIGASGITIPAMRAEGGAWSATHPQTGETVMLTEGGTVTAMNAAGNTNTYMLSSDGMGMWTAAYQAVMISVPLGASEESAMLTRTEDGSYWYEGDAFMSGDEAHTSDDRHYVLTYADGAWTAMFRPDSMEIKGAGGLMAYSRETDAMYDVEAPGSGIELAETGMGEVTTSMGAMYRVRMEDGMLLGQRTDAAKKNGTRYRTVGLAAHVEYIADDPDTADVNEKDTGIVIAGEKLLFDDLLGRGSAMKAKAEEDGAPGEFVQDAVKKLTDLRAEAELYAGYQAESPGTQDYDNNLTRVAQDAQKAIDTIFDKGALFDATDFTDVVDLANCDVCAGLPYEDGATDATDDDGYTADTSKALRAVDTVRALTRLIDALSSQAAFVEATAKGGNGVFENALTTAKAEAAYSANKSAYDVLFGTTGSTRYGAITMMSRVGPDPDVDTDTDPETFTANVDANATAAATYDLRFWFDGFNVETDKPADGIQSDEQVGREDVGRIGAFAYSIEAETLRARDMAQTGGASYVGGTVAVTPGTAQDHQLFHGSMHVDVNFRRRSVFGRISELKDEDGNLWKYLDRDVAEIYLPRRFYDSLARFGGSADADPANTEGAVNNDAAGDATIVYAQTHGFPLPTVTDDTARFSGRFIGEDGAEIAGVWSIGEAAPAMPTSVTFTGNDISGVTLRDGTTGTTSVPDATDTANDNRDIIYGSFGVTREGDRGLPGEAANDDASSGAANQARLAGGTGTYVGTRTDGTLRLGNYFTGGDDKFTEFKLADIFVAPGGDPKSNKFDSLTHVARVVAFIEKQRDIYEAYTSLDDDSTNLNSVANAGRQRAWLAIINEVRTDLFGLDEFATGAADADDVLPAIVDLLDADGASNPDGVPDNNTHLAHDNNLQSPLGSLFFPLTRTGNPDDGAALDRIQALLDALESADALGGALADNGGGVFDNMPYLRSGTGLTRPFGMGGRTVAQIFNALGSQTTLWSLSTNYTRFGVWWRQEWATANVKQARNSAATNNTGAEAPNSYAYSWLRQSSYRVKRVEQTYPGAGLATYTGHTLALLDDRVFKGDADVKVTWGAATDGIVPTSNVLPTFSNFRQVNTDDPLRLGNRGANNDEGGAGSSRIVDEISFIQTASDFTTPDASPNMLVSHDIDTGNLSVMGDDAAVDAGNAIQDIKARITFPTSLDHVEVTTATFEAVFVGESLDGPLGIAGMWRINDFGASEANRGDAATTASKNDDLIGAFGADLAAFETLFRP